MSDFLILPLLFAASLLLTLLIRRLALRREWLDVPNARSSHTRPTPKSGGLAFALVFSAGGAWGHARGLIGTAELAALGLGLPAALVGLFDDLFNLTVEARIGAHAGLALGVLLLLAPVPASALPGLGALPGWLLWPLVVLALVWLINLYNFMDGIDGLAVLEGLFACLAAAFFAARAGHTGDLFLLLALAAALAGFLPLNLPRARIFMGDTGSTWLGLVLGTLGLISSSHGYMHLWSWSILLGVFITDSTLTLIRRAGRGDVWYHAHRSHAYQNASRRLQSHGRVGVFVTLINFIWLFPLACISLAFVTWAIPITIIAYIPLIILGFFFKAGVGQDPGEAGSAMASDYDLHKG